MRGTKLLLLMVMVGCLVVAVYSCAGSGFGKTEVEGPGGKTESGGKKTSSGDRKKSSKDSKKGRDTI